MRWFRLLCSNPSRLSARVHLSGSLAADHRCRRGISKTQVKCGGAGRARSGARLGQRPILARYSGPRESPTLPARRRQERPLVIRVIRRSNPSRAPVRLTPPLRTKHPGTLLLNSYSPGELIRHAFVRRPLGTRSPDVHSPDACSPGPLARGIPPRRRHPPPRSARSSPPVRTIHRGGRPRAIAARTRAASE